MKVQPATFLFLAHFYFSGLVTAFVTKQPAFSFVTSTSSHRLAASSQHQEDEYGEDIIAQNQKADFLTGKELEELRTHIRALRYGRTIE